MGFFSKKKSASPEAPGDAPATTTEAPKIEAPATDAAPAVAPPEDPFAAQRAAGDDPFAAQRSPSDDPFAAQRGAAAEQLAGEPLDASAVEVVDGPVGQPRTSREWDASKVPPSQFQKRKGSIYSTPGSRDSHHGSTDRDKAYHDKLKEKGWNLFGKSKS